MTSTIERERALARRLVEDLRRVGALRSDRWTAAFQAVPRHVFVPQFYVERDGAYELLDGTSPERRDEWLEAVYADEPLPTQLDGETWLSSSTQPSLMARMLEALHVTDGDRVLEIGTGTGYNAALLAAGYGSRQVASLDIDPELVETARARLRQLGIAPTLAVADGADGYPDAAPYDCIMATCSMPAVPPAWIAQTRPGGHIMVNLYRELGGGPIALLQVDDRGEASGRLLPFCGGFMPTRSYRSTDALQLLEHHGHGEQRSTEVDAAVLDDDAFGVFAALMLPGVQRIGVHPTDAFPQSWLLHLDGSWACHEADKVTEGRGKLWSRVEALHQDWLAADCPRREDFGLTVTADGNHRLWTGATDGPAWPL